jgi:hypothetical protein
MSQELKVSPVGIGGATFTEPDRGQTEAEVDIGNSRANNKGGRLVSRI